MCGMKILNFCFNMNNIFYHKLNDNDLFIT